MLAETCLKEMENSHQQGVGETPDSPLAFSVPTSLQDYIRRSVCRRRKVLFITAACCVLAVLSLPTVVAI